MRKNVLTIKLICFDFDGTIADTMPWLEENAVRLFNEVYKTDKGKARHDYRMTTGLPFSQQVELIYPNGNQNKFIIETFEHEKITRIDEQQLFPETKEVIKNLSQNYLIAVSSSTTKEIIDDYIKKKGIKNYLNDVVGFRPGFEKGKHHFDYLMEKFSLTPAELIYIGDSKKDMERAYNSNIKFIARLGPMFAKSDFSINNNGTVVQFPCITSLKDVEAILNSIEDN